MKKSSSAKRHLKHTTVTTLQLHSMCLIPVALVFVFSYLPMIGIIIGFKDFRFDLGMFGSPWVGFENFEIFLRSNDFAKVAWNTVSLNALFIVVSTVCQILLAVLLYEVRSRRATKVYQTVLITPHFVSWVIAGYMLYAFLNPQLGFINKFITTLGGKGISWYSEPKYWPVILTIAHVWKNIGMNSVIYYAALMGVDSSLVEAAQIDGANKVQTTFRVVIPQLYTLITILTILAIGGIFRADFGLFYQLPRNVGALYEVTDVMDTWVYRTMRVVGDMSISTAAGLIQSVVGFTLVVITNTVVKKIDPDRALF